MFVSKKIEIKNSGESKSLFTLEEIKKDQVILEFERNFLSQPTKTSMQIDENKHQESTNPETAENFLNHSCDPNCYIDFQNLTLKALRNIGKGEEVTFNYLTTEWDLAKKFKCNCESKKCKEQITGFKHLSSEEKLELLPYLSPFLRKKA